MTVDLVLDGGVINGLLLGKPNGISVEKDVILILPSVYRPTYAINPTDVLIRGRKEDIPWLEEDRLKVTFVIQDGKNGLKVKLAFHTLRPRKI